ncbi:MAG: ABC transporter permease [Chloroflexi bacterium]|nr:MAG: ABC transporter permease [Chloroflexota bacterium]
MTTRSWQWLWRACAVLTAAILLAPILVVVPMSFTNSSTLAFPPEGLSLRWYAELLTNPQWTLRIPVSVETALATAVLATLLGTLAALGMTRGNFPGRGLLTALFLAPLVVPIIDLAVGDYFVWALGWQVGPVGFGGSLAGTVPGLVLAHTVLAFPFPFLTVSTSLTTVDRTLELAAAGLGANPWKTFQKITLPLIRTGVITGAIFAFLTSWDEVVVASFLASPRVSTVPVQIFTELRQSYDPAAAAISSVLLAAAVVLVGLLALIPLLARRAYGRSTDNLAEIVSGERGVLAASS